MSIASLTQQKGTLLYMSPEIYENYEYSPASDVYAFGVIVYEIVTSLEPFAGSIHLLYESDKSESIRFLKLAAENGNLKAMLNYARKLKKGDGIPVDKREAIKYYKMSADKGNINAMFKYAIMLEKGDGIPVDKTEAIK